MSKSEAKKSEKKSIHTVRDDDHEGAAFHHESAAHHHQEAARHAGQGDLPRAERHAAAADHHSRSASAHRDAVHQSGQSSLDEPRDRDRRSEASTGWDHDDRGPHSSDSRRIATASSSRQDRDRSMDGRPNGDGRRPARANQDERGDGAADRDRNYSSPANRSGTSDGMHVARDRDHDEKSTLDREPRASDGGLDHGSSRGNHVPMEEPRR